MDQRLLDRLLAIERRLHRLEGSGDRPARIPSNRLLLGAGGAVRIEAFGNDGSTDDTEDERTVLLLEDGSVSVYRGDGSSQVGILDNLGATAKPGTGDDEDDGYAVGSRWIDVTNDKSYVCLDASAGAAVWGLAAVGGVAVDAHAARHERAGADEIDGDHLDVDFTPSNYTPATTPAEAAHVDDLAAHLYGIDQALGGSGSNSITTGCYGSQAYTSGTGNLSWSLTGYTTLPGTSDTALASVGSGVWAIVVGVTLPGGGTAEFRLQDTTAGTTIATITGVTTSGVYSTTSISNYPSGSTQSVQVQARTQSANGFTISCPWATLHVEE